APHQIRVNCVCPGIVDTPIHPEGAVKSMQQAQPLGRVGQPNEVAQAIYFLATESSAWTTGAVLHVDGGINLA
ncbi:MAG: SDR family NAD(P)-dependent oxidoreductase, partial [Bdellovibrionales bacterium]